LLPGFALPIGSGTAGIPGSDVGNDSAAAGAQIGFNYQIGQTVLGLEADIQATDLKDASITTPLFLSPPVPLLTSTRRY
jgi:hypothetical protein